MIIVYHGGSKSSSSKKRKFGRHYLVTFLLLLAGFAVLLASNRKYPLSTYLVNRTEEAALILISSGRSEKRGEREGEGEGGGGNTTQHYPVWSAAAAFARQREGGREHDRSGSGPAGVEFRTPGRGPLRPLRNATEFLTYGLGAVLPYYGTILPAFRYEGDTFRDTSEVEVAVIPDASIVALDLHECLGERETYNVCYYPTTTNSGGGGGEDEPKNDDDGTKYRAHCYLPGQFRLTGRKHNHHSGTPGHELWSCSHREVNEQLAAAQVLDFLLFHHDRFRRRSTNNLFFLERERERSGGVVRFVSIDHDRLPRNDFFRNMSFEGWVQSKQLLKYEIPLELRGDLRRVRLRNTKEDFVRTLNVSLDGQLDRLTGVMAGPGSATPNRNRTPPPNATALTDILWTRFESLVNFYGITATDDD